MNKFGVDFGQIMIRKFKIFFWIIGLLFSSNQALSQAGLCPPNLDFEMGDFTNWECQAGIVDPAGNLVISPTPPLANRHTIISAATAGVDPYGGFPELCPNGSGFSVKLGNSSGGHQAEGVSYTYTIPSTLTVFSMIFHYAVVLQDPFHNPWEQPRFRARITDLSTGLPIPCVDFDFIASSSLPGFVLSPFGNSVYYKNWTPITINLNAFIGRTIKLEFITNDCTFTAHFGYAYLDVNTTCNGAIEGTTLCEGDDDVTLTAPFGFQSYQWFTDVTFSTLMSTAQSVTIAPAPAPGTIYPVIVTPFAGFGCVDTLYGIISAISPNPVSVAGPDASICKNQPVQIGGPPTATYTYAWIPASQVSNPASSNPTAWNISPNPTEFIVHTTDILTGCSSYDTVIVSNIVVDTAIRLNGVPAFCDYGIPEATLSVNNTSSAVQWYNNTNPVPGATGFSYQPLTTGNYWAQVTQNGCTDTTASIPININPLPQVSFYPDKDTGCVTNNSFLFTNTSTIADNSAMTYNWKFSDGTTLQTTDATKSFSPVGSYTTELVATSNAGCKDSIGGTTIHILPNGVPDFTWDSACLNRPVLFTNLSNENGSSSVNYNWNFNNGGPVSTIKDPIPVVYSTRGARDVILEMTTLGCENDPQTITKQILVNQADAGVRYRTITVPFGSSQFIHVRDSIGSNYSWKPKTQLSSYDSQYTEFFATGNDVEYLIDITDNHTCITTDTLLMQVLKKTGFYLPTAFTPNGDGLNDIARPYLIGMKELKSFSVYNRWGNLLFYTRKYGEGWNGKSKGIDQPNGVYVWILEFYDNNNVLITEKGTITIIR